MRVLAYPSDRGATGRYRICLPVYAAQLAGCDVKLGSSAGKGEGIPVERIPLPGGRTGIRPKPLDADVVVMQRVLTEGAAAVIQSLQAGGVAVVVDIDDDMARLDPRHPSHREFNPRLHPDCNWHWLQQACRQADLVTVTTDALARRYGSHGRVAVLPNRVPESMLSIDRERHGDTVGWAGWTVTHPGDLTVTRGGVQDALTRTGARFLKIGPKDSAQRDLNLTHPPDFTGGLPQIGDYYEALALLDVGIAPLLSTQFNQGKSWLKALEYMAAGTPWVASPTDDYVKLAGYGAGQIAKDRSRDWSRAITRLLTDREYWTEQSDLGRQIVAEHHTVEAAGHLWAEAWERALAYRRSARTPHRRLNLS